MSKQTEELVKLHYPVIAPLLMGSGFGDGKTTMCVMAQAACIDALVRWNLRSSRDICREVRQAAYAYAYENEIFQQRVKYRTSLLECFHAFAALK